MQIDGKTIGGDRPYIIAEIGNNHQGSVETCKRLIKMAADAGCDAVKLQKRCNPVMFMQALLDAPYDNENSYGRTYGEHREALEFGALAYSELQSYAKASGITFFATAFDAPSADFLCEFDVPAYKIASADLTNTPLIEYVASFGRPMIVSTGGAHLADIQRIWKLLSDRGAEFALLHCVASYPNRDEQINLRAIETMRKLFPGAVIGWSSHHPGILCNFLAYMMGARIFEVHITENRAAKGTDHAFSLEPHAVHTLVEDMRRIPTMLGHGHKIPLPEEKKPILKMGKAIHPARTIQAGEPLQPGNIRIAAPAAGLPPYLWDQVIGKISITGLSTADEIRMEDLK